MASRRNGVLGLVVGLLAVLVLAGCGGGRSAEDVTASLAGPQRDWYAQAREEPPLKWYTSHDPASMKRAVDAFEARYPGLRVEPLRLTSGSLAVRYAQERDSNAPTADVLSVADKPFMSDGLEKGWFTPLAKTDLPSAAAFDDRFFDRGMTTTLVTQYGIAYNTDLVPDPPKDWPDVLDPRWQGKVVVPDFRNSTLYVYHARSWLDRYGEDYLRRLHAMAPIVVDSMIPGIQLVAAGRASIAVMTPLTTINPLVEDGAPLKVVFPPNPIGVDLDTAISTTAAAPGHARLFYDFLLSPEGQTAFVGSGSSSPIGAPGTMPLPAGHTTPDWRTNAQTLEEVEAVFPLP